MVILNELEERDFVISAVIDVINFGAVVLLFTLTIFAIDDPAVYAIELRVLCIWFSCALAIKVWFILTTAREKEDAICDVASVKSALKTLMR